MLDIPHEARAGVPRVVPPGGHLGAEPALRGDRHPPAASGRARRPARALYYATQADVCPPTFYVSTNLPAAVGEPYRRYLTNQLRQIYGFDGSPLRVVLRGRGRKKTSVAPPPNGDRRQK